MKSGGCALPVLLALASLASLPDGPRADSFPPLEIGRRWIYEVTGQSSRDTVVSTGLVVFDGEVVHELSYHGWDEGLFNYWSVDVEGAVLFHGFDRPGEHFAVHYVPALRMIAPPAFVGRTWIDTVVARCLRAPCDGGQEPFTAPRRIVDLGTHTVPAGTFSAVAIETEIPQATATFSKASAYTVLGTRRSSAAAEVQSGRITWWVNGVGMVEDSAGWILLQLDFVTATRRTTWSRVKGLYR